ncbi:1-alkyl-2-acetylglycerophosphocholine esterase [Cryptococcus gattii Ru294]|uniref:Putative phospholipase n=2 Tax=Cryptococcus gattii TaxID=37769 RepID=E6R9W2_CRYGW|nr:Platelet-activating factor acetylhydrolase 2, cytoplasmic, putative [Cryptococcus gattii WM276]ADV23587.1 Platelet-activating factor acetylhydrolase 2, cytoplasmic, putative [Cryptococcus gattii WM276]KIR54716.1 1-alkyl-2-acetylglycerophosphocholine esterase [Cryptococcus gattii Ru294]KIR77702.1 1-alkyl-2-acetylglycerophosphocholine esterase [Cryptococcus gattii EJB2]KIY36008.1 1-alkyl-2-acetylglycerophosphocholine esterase [Cryptococcus gattii E566]
MILPPILTASLPSPPGPHAVGYTFLTHPPLSPFFHPFPALKSTGKPAFRIEEIGYCLFYPTLSGGKEGKRWVNWVPEPFCGVIKGYERFLGGKGGMSWLVKPLGYIAGRLQMPLYPRAPLNPTDKPYPLLIFSHGLAGTRHTYSQLCAALASEGYIVLAVEHRDGSGPAVVLPPGENKESRMLYYTGVDDISWAEGEEHPVTHARTLQLDIRTREVYEAYHSFKRLLSHEGDLSIKIEGLEGDVRQSWIDSMKGKVDFDDLKLTGHSFGGGTILHLLQTPPPSNLLPSLPAKQAIALDPWLEPLPTPSDILQPATSSSMPPTLVINSAGFTEWPEHWEKLVDMMKGKGILVTMIGIGHQSFSDFPLLSPSGYSHAHSMIVKIHELSTAFLNRKLLSGTALAGKVPDKGDYERDEDGVKIKGKAAMKDGDVLLHLADKE